MELDVKRTWCEIDLSSLEFNVNNIKSYAKKTLIAVVKADAYGHGYEPVARKILDMGLNRFAVSTINEAMEIREIDGSAFILILGYTPPQFADILSVNRITQTIVSYQHAELISKNATRKISCHIAVDTGMGRLGLRYDDPHITEKIGKIKNLPNLNIDYIFTHFAGAVIETDYTNFQHDRIEDISKKNDLPFHCQNSAGGTSNYGGDFVRAGISMYGIKPDEDMALPYPLKPVMRMKSTIGHIKTLKKGEFVSYGMTYQAPEDIEVAVICAGYADGYPRALSNKGYVYINGNFCPVIGRVCMDMFMVNISNISANVGDEAELFGEHIAANKLAGLANTIGYELTCGISKRVPRHTYS